MVTRWHLGIDGGGSGSRGRLTDPTTHRVIERKGGPANLVSDTQGAIREILELANGLADEAGIATDRINFAAGLAGSSNDSGVTQLETALFESRFRQVKITSDAITSWIGAAGGQPAVVGAIGTGAVAIAPDEAGKPRIFGGWGLALGDEGSGAWLGREAVRYLLLSCETANVASTMFLSSMMEEIPVVSRDLLNWSLDASPADFALLAPIVTGLGAKGDGTALSLLDQGAACVARLLKRADGGRELPWSLVGGMATVWKPRLGEAMSGSWFEAAGTSLDGASMLASGAVEI